jgi:predicted dehydrogenase
MEQRVGQGPNRRWSTAIIGHTGAGDYGHDLDDTCSRMPELDVVAVADPVPEGRERAAARSGAARTYASYEEMLAREHPDLVVVATRHVEGHEAMLLAAVRAGAHVYCEKPLVRTPAEADRVLAAAAGAGVHIAVAHICRAFSAMARIRALIAEGSLGRLRRIRGFGKCDPRGGGQDLAVLGTHILDLMCYFAGAPAWAHAHVTQDGQDVTLADAREGDEGVGPVAGNGLTSYYAFHSGVTGEFETLVAEDGSRTSYFSLLLEGTAGSIGIRSFGDRQLYRYHRPLQLPGLDEHWEPLVLPGHTPEGPDDSGERYIWAHHQLIRDLLTSVEERRLPLASGQVAATALEMIMATYASHLTGRRVSFPLANREHPLAGAMAFAASAPPAARALQPSQEVTAAGTTAAGTAAAT